MTVAEDKCLEYAREDHPLIEEMARAIWNANHENDGTPLWDNLKEFDEPIRTEVRLWARAAIHVVDRQIARLEKELEQAREAGRIMLEVFPLMGGEPGPDMHAQVAARQKMKDALTAPKPQGGTEEVKE